MKKYYYIEVMNQEGEVMARFATTYGDMRFDASFREEKHPDHGIRMVIASQKEKVFNNLQLQSA